MNNINTTIITVCKDNIYEWQKEAKEIFMNTNRQIVSIKTPRQFGKTTFAISMIDAIHAHSIFFYTPFINEVCNIFEIYYKYHNPDIDYIKTYRKDLIEFQKNDTFITFTRDKKTLNNNNRSFIIIDNMDKMYAVDIYEFLPFKNNNTSKLLCLENSKINLLQNTPHTIMDTYLTTTKLFFNCESIIVQESPTIKTNKKYYKIYSNQQKFFREIYNKIACHF